VVKEAVRRLINVSGLLTAILRLDHEGFDHFKQIARSLSRDFWEK
jgi:hypothetical protein